MKNYFFALVCLLTTTTAYTQYDVRGIWRGTLNGARDLEVSFEITGDNADVLTAALDVPMQGAKGLKCDTVYITNDTLIVSMKMINGKYTGKIANVNRIEGFWVQNGLSVPLDLDRTKGKIQLNRPQTPQPPFSYKVEEFVFFNRNKSMQFGATITAPKDNKRHPAVILISGSGPQNRDEEIFQHRPFAVVADHLTKQGYVVMRIDDRGVGATGGERENATSRDFADDVIEAIEYLKTRPEVNKRKIGLYGHSEGGLIAQLVAAERDDIDFIVLMAAPGVPVKQTMVEQNKAIIMAGSLGEETAEGYAVLYKDIIDDITSSTSRDEVERKMNKSIDSWKAKTNKDIVLQTTGIKDSMSQEVFVYEFLEQAWNNWTVYFMNYKPGPVIEQLDCKVLALNGDRDIQVISRSNLEGIQQALEKSKSKEFEVREIQGVNHLFQECEKCTVQEYAEIEQTIKPEVLDIVANWLNEHVK